MGTIPHDDLMTRIIREAQRLLGWAQNLARLSSCLLLNSSELLEMLRKVGENMFDDFPRLGSFTAFGFTSDDQIGCDAST